LTLESEGLANVDVDVDEPNAPENNLSVKYSLLFNGSDKYNDILSSINE
jgi:hypothetical protein